MINGEEREVVADEADPLLIILRNDLNLKAAKFGCGYGQCGSCSIIIDGIAARSCAIPVGLAEGHEITTLEGLSNSGCPDLLQLCFVQAQAAQCGYCLNGMIMTAKAFLRRNSSPSDAEIREELRYNLCRCGTHIEIINAIKLAVARGGAEDEHE